MTQPTPYVPDYSFTDFSSGSPTSQPPGVKLDAEYQAVARTLGEVLANLALIQRDDGSLANGSVGVAQFSAGARALIAQAAFNVLGTWEADTPYDLGDIVCEDGVVYLVIAAHTSSATATDLAAGRLALMFDVANEILATALALSTGAGLIGSTGGLTVQAALNLKQSIAALAAATGAASVGTAAGISVEAALALKASYPVLSATTGAANIGFARSGTGAVARTVAQVLTQYVNALDFGAINDGTGDATTGIQAALDAVSPTLTSKGYCVYIPDGLYYLDGMVTVESYKSLIASPGARFLRKSSRSASVLPMLYGKGNYWTIDLGGAWLTSENNSPSGLVSLGQRSIDSDTHSAQHWTFRHAQMFPRTFGFPGAPKPSDGQTIGIFVPSAQPVVGSSAPNYFGLIDDVAVHGASEALYMTDIVNGHTINDLRVNFFYNHAIKLTGAYGNTIRGCFINGCYEATGGVMIELARNSRPSAPHAATHQSSRNHISGSTGELYWTSGTGLKIALDCSDNIIDFGFASPGTIIDNSEPVNSIRMGRRLFQPRINSTSLPVYADEAAATGGALEAGEFYRTSAGALRVKL